MLNNEESGIVKDCDNCGDLANGDVQIKSDKNQKITDNEAKGISNVDGLIIVKDHDKELKFKIPIREDDDYYMYMISHFIDDGFSLKSSEENSKKNSASYSLQRKRKRSKSESSNHYCDNEKDNEYNDLDNKEDKSNANVKESAEPENKEEIIEPNGEKDLENSINKIFDDVDNEILDSDKNNDTVAKDEIAAPVIYVDHTVIRFTSDSTECNTESVGKYNEED